MASIKLHLLTALSAAAWLSACGSSPSDLDGGATDGGATDSGPTDGGGADAGPGRDAGPAPGTWQLPEGYFTPAHMPMHLVHPRNDEAATWAYAKNAHPGIRWEIPIVIQGGAWPFRYEIVDNGGADGLAVGSELERSREDGFIVHRVTDAYGLLWWDTPEAGAYEILVRVVDQEGATIDVPISLQVGTAGWVFVDADRGDDANDGTADAPFATLSRLYGATRSEFAEHRVYLAGVVPMDGNRDSGNLRVAQAPGGDPDLAPRVWVGWPGREAVLEAYEGKFVVDAEDFYIANLEYRHREDYVPDDGSFIHMFTVWSRTARFTLHDVAFTRFQGVPVNVGLGNSSIMMFTRGRPREHVAVVNCTQSGPNGILTSTYSLRHSVFEKNRAVDAEITLADNSVWTVIYIKGDNEFVTVRANQYWNSNTWNATSGALGISEARNTEFTYNTIDTPFDTGRRGALKLWTNSPQASFTWTVDTPVWFDRNSLRRVINWEGDRLANMPDGTVFITRNILEDGTVPTSSRIVPEGNLDADTYFDDQMRLTGSVRTDNLGRVGAEIAVPE